MRVAIHQPNFMPWLGLFNKLAMVDRFVVYDHVQAMGGSSWLTRNRILVQGEARWLTMPIVRSGTGLPPVNEVRVQWESRLVGKQLRTLEQEYGAHPHFDEVFGLVTELYGERPPLIAQLNEAFIRRVATRLGLAVEFVSSTELCAREPRLRALSGSELVLATCQAAGGDEYVCGEGGVGYIDPPAFEAAGVAFWWQRYAPPEYPQRRARSFVSHLSVLDALCNVGFAGTRELIEHEARERVAA
jgi:hypothetical protein